MTALEQVAAAVHEASGIRLAEAQHLPLQAALDRVGVGAAEFVHRRNDALAGRELMARLIDEVTVKETSFLRDHAQLQEIPWAVLLVDAQARGAGKLRVWSAGCATGEEAYSLALLAVESFASTDPPVTILATDISASAIARANAGSYGPRSVRDLGAPVRRRYFEQRRDRLVVGGDLRRLVTFAAHNIVRDPVPPLGEEQFDLILCRNVLIYFDGDTVQRVIGSLERALRPSGMLLLGAADALCGSAGRLQGLTAGSQPAVRPSRSRRHPSRKVGGRAPMPTAEEALVAFLTGAGNRASCDVVASAEQLLARDPLNAVAYFVRGLAELEGDDPDAAVRSLRRALYVDPCFGLAAFKLGRAHEALGNPTAARRAYEQALRGLEPEDDRHDALRGQVDLADIAEAARTRLRALAAVGIASRAPSPTP